MHLLSQHSLVRDEAVGGASRGPRLHLDDRGPLTGLGRPAHGASVHSRGVVPVDLSRARENSRCVSMEGGEAGGGGIHGGLRIGNGRFRCTALRMGYMAGAFSPSLHIYGFDARSCNTLMHGGLHTCREWHMGARRQAPLCVVNALALTRGHESHESPLIHPQCEPRF